VPLLSSGSSRRTLSGGRKRLAAIIAAAGLGLLVLGYGTAFALTGEKVPEDTTVLGVALGGLSEDEAKAKLRAGVGDRLNLPVKVEAAGRNYQVKPAEAGLELDVDATLEAAGVGRSLNPVRMWQVMTGGDTVEPVIKADADKLKAVTDRLASRVDRPATEGTVTFDGTSPVQNRSRPPA
jgi:hypothetical protein